MTKIMRVYLQNYLYLSYHLSETSSAESFKKAVVSYKRKYEHELLVNRLFKIAQEKVWLGELTVPP